MLKYGSFTNLRDVIERFTCVVTNLKIGIEEAWNDRFNQFGCKITTPTNERNKIDIIAVEFLKKLKERKEQKRSLNTLEKNSQKKRIVFGAHETLRSVHRGTAQLVFYAKNLDENNARAASNIHSLQRICPIENIPMIEVLTRKEMSRVVNKFPYVGVIGILDTFGFEDDVNEIIKEWRKTDSCKLFHIDQPSFLP